jgi:carbon-monoxide dehydrogenase medium subunit
MYAFDYRRPHSLNEADLAFKAMPGAKILAGGQTLIPTMKNRLAKPDALIDLGGIAELKKIGVAGNAISVGAMATHNAVASSADVKAALPALAGLAAGIGDPHVRNRGTIGGSVANNDPAADYPAAVLALGATIQTDKRQIAADDFFQGLFATALDETEILTAVSFPKAKFGYAKFANPASRYALVGVAVALRDGNVRVAVTGAGNNGVFRVPAMEAALKANFAPAALAGVANPDPSVLISDIHADAAYRAHLIGVLAKRAVAAAA